MTKLKIHFPTQRSLAIALNISPTAVNQWFIAKQVPIRRAVQISKMTGLTLNELRPDIFD
jgi:DNA-binding transcriptional regulator YdaS (Cro superfamily)